MDWELANSAQENLSLGWGQDKSLFVPLPVPANCLLNLTFNDIHSSREEGCTIQYFFLLKTIIIIIIAWRISTFDVWQVGGEVEWITKKKRGCKF